MQVDGNGSRNSPVLGFSDRKYLDDYEMRLEQTESGIRALALDVVKIRSGEGLPLSSLENKALPRYSPRKSNLPRQKTSSLRRDDAPYPGRESHVRPRSPSKQENVPAASSADPNFPSNGNATSYPRTAYSDYHFSQRGRCHLPREKLPVSDPLVSTTCAGHTDSSSEFDDDDCRGVSLEVCQPQNRRATTSRKDTRMHRSDVTKPFSSHPEPTSRSRRHTIDSAVKNNTAKSPERTIRNNLYSASPSSKSPLGRTIPAMGLHDVKSCRDTLRALEREAEQRTCEETEKIRKKANETLRKHWHHIDDEYSKKFNILREELAAEQEARKEERILAAGRESALESQLREARKNNEDLTVELNNMERQVRAYLGKIERLEDTTEHLEMESHQLRTRLTHIESEKDQLEKQLLMERGCGGRLECDLDHAQAQLSRVGSEKRQLEEELERAEKARDLLLREFGPLKDTLKDTEVKLADMTTSHISLQTQLDDIVRDNSHLKLRNAELEDLLAQKRETETHELAVVEDLRHREHHLRQELANSMQKLEEKDEKTKELFSLKRNYELLRDKLSDVNRELLTATTENKRLEAYNEKTAIELRKLCNDNLALKQENLKLRKEVQTLRLSSGPSNPIIGDPGVLGSMSGKASRSGPYVGVDGELSQSSLPAAGYTASVPSEWEYKPPDGIPLHGGGGSNKVAPVPEPQQPVITGRSCLPGMDPYLSGGTIASSNKQPALSKMHNEGLEKQLMLLQMEKNQIEADLGKLPGTTRGRTLKERAVRVDLERRLQDVDVNIHKIRQELRLSGAYQRSLRYT